MLIWIIFLVLSAVVLTVLGVGMLDMYGKARIEKKKMIKEGAVAGRYKDGVISIADVIRLPNNQYHVLNDLEKEVVKYHERFHEVADELGFLDEAKKEHYADLTAIRAAYDDHGREAALGAVDFVKKMGRAKDSEAIKAIEKLLENGYDGLTSKEKKMIKSGDEKISNFYSVANNFYSRFGDRENDGSERNNYDMRLSPLIYDAEGKSRITKVVKGVGGFISDMYEGSKKISDKYAGYEDKSKIKTKDLLDGIENPLTKIIKEKLYKPVGLSK